MLKTNFKNHSPIQTQSYFLIKEQLEKQNATLMKQRSAISQQTQPYSHNQHLSRREGLSENHYNLQNQQSDSIVNAVKKKVEELINICEKYTQKNNQQIHVSQIMQAQKKILWLLNKKSDYKQFQQPHQQNKSLLTKTNLQQRKQPINRTSSSESPHQLQNLRQYIGDQAMQMIEEIQRKALQEIESLRSDKIDLLKKLNDQIKAHNKEKQKATRLQNQHRMPPQNIKKNYHQEKIRSNTSKFIMKENIQNQYQFNNAPVMQRIQPQQQYQQPSSQKYSNIQPRQVVQQRKLLQSVNPQNIIVNLPPNSSKSSKNQAQNIAFTNEQYKSNIPQDPHKIQLKNELKSQLGHLSEKIQQYRQILEQQKRKNEAFSMKQLKNLLNQSNQITQQGYKLANNRKISQPRTTIGQYPTEQFNNRPNKSINRKSIGKISERSEREGSFEERPALLTFCPADRYKYNRNSTSGFDSSLHV